jgi:hypothetical protein
LLIKASNEDSYFIYDNSVYHLINASLKATDCNKVNKVEVYDSVEKCTKDISVSFVLNSNTVFGYLTQENIIRPKNK